MVSLTGDAKKVLHWCVEVPMAELTVPQALNGMSDSAGLVGPDDYFDRKSLYCRVCRAHLKFIPRGVRAAHFSHRPNEACSQHRIDEGIRVQREKEAIQTVQSAIECAIAGTGPEPVIRSKRLGNGTLTSVLEMESLEGCEVHEEFWLDAVSHRLARGRRPDLALLDSEGEPIFMIEVFATSRADAGKHGDYAALGIPWIELDVEEVESSTPSGSNPLVLHDIATAPLSIEPMVTATIEEGQPSPVAGLEIPAGQWRHGISEMPPSPLLPAAGRNILLGRIATCTFLVAALSGCTMWAAHNKELPFYRTGLAREVRRGWRQFWRGLQAPPERHIKRPRGFLAVLKMPPRGRRYQ